MAAEKLSERIYSVGILNPLLRIFDVVMKTDYGTTYNSFIVKGNTKTALIDTCHLSYFDRYADNIKSVCNMDEIDYIILNHCEPDHSGALKKLAVLCKNAKIVVSKAGSIYLKNILNDEIIDIQIAKDGDQLDLGGLNLKFISAPFLHWPDSMFTWCEDEKTLFSCDFFGCHYCEPHVFDYNIVYEKKYFSALKDYYGAIFGPFAAYVRSGLQKIQELRIERVCTSHGPVLTKTKHFPEVMRLYSQWSEQSNKTEFCIPVFYCSAYGNTGRIAEAIADGIRKVKPEACVTVFDINEHDMNLLQSEINLCDALCIGSPTINADAVAPVWELLSHVDAINSRKKPALVFGSFGWSGEAVPNISDRLRGLKMNIFCDGFKVCFVPSDDDIIAAEKLGTEFADSF